MVPYILCGLSNKRVSESTAVHRRSTATQIPKKALKQRSRPDPLKLLRVRQSYDNWQVDGQLTYPHQTSTSWWFQPIWKILVKMGIFPQIGVKIKNIRNHQLVNCLSVSFSTWHAIHHPPSITPFSWKVGNWHADFTPPHNVGHRNQSTNSTPMPNHT